MSNEFQESGPFSRPRDDIPCSYSGKQSADLKLETRPKLEVYIPAVANVDHGLKVKL
jgi:hypothetical protein